MARGWARRDGEAMPVTEAAWRRVVIDLVRALGYRVRYETFSLGSDAGFPDLTIIGKGRVIFAELKSARGRLTPGQAEYLDWLRGEGLEAHVWRPADFEAARVVLAGGDAEAVGHALVAAVDRSGYLYRYSDEPAGAGTESLVCGRCHHDIVAGTINFGPEHDGRIVTLAMGTETECASCFRVVRQPGLVEEEASDAGDDER